MQCQRQRFQTRGRKRAGVQQKECEVLTNLEQVKITEAGGIEAVVAAMKAHKTSVLVQEQVCRALMNLATTATRSR